MSVIGSDSRIRYPPGLLLQRRRLDSRVSQAIALIQSNGSMAASLRVFRFRFVVFVVVLVIKLCSSQEIHCFGW
jgi:hypothetical protein